MNLEWNILYVMVLTGFSGIASSEAVTGEIRIDDQEYSFGSTTVIQGNGKTVTDRRKLSGFEKLSVNVTADIEYIASDNYQLELTADDNIASVITSTITGKTLSIDTDRSFTTQSIIRVRIFGPPTLNGLIVDGSSNINLQGISGESLQINLDGTGDIVVQGKVKNLIVMVDGSGNVNTKALQAENVIIDVDGTTDVTVTANRKLDVAINGVSHVTYYGHPNSINKTIDGVGEVSTGN